MLYQIERRKLFQSVADQLAEAIVSGRYAAGDLLPSERGMMSAFAVGRPAVREALLMLQLRGLVEIRHGRRARVVGKGDDSADSLRDTALALLASSAATVDEIKEARLVLEIAIARRAAERASDADIERMMAALDDNRRAIPSRDAYLATDIAFHRTIAAISRNALFEAASEAMLSWLARFRVDMVHVEGANLLSHDEHARIAQAIAAREPDAAERAMADHQRRSHSLYKRLARTPASTVTKSKSTKGRKSWPKVHSSP